MPNKFVSQNEWTTCVTSWMQLRVCELEVGTLAEQFSRADQLPRFGKVKQKSSRISSVRSLRDGAHP